MNKQCSSCKQNKKLDEFYKDKCSKDGYHHRCRECGLKEGNKYYKENKKHCRKVRKERYAKNPERYRQEAHKYRELNPEKLVIYRKEYGSRPEVKRKNNKRDKIRYAMDIDFKLRKLLRNGLYRVVRKSLSPEIIIIAGSAIDDLGCSIDYFKSHIENLWTEGMNWNNYGKKPGCWSFDHIIPISHFDLTKRKHILKVCHYSNIRPMWHCGKNGNIAKGNKLDIVG